MAEVIRALQEHAQELAGSPPHPILGPPSLSVGRIEGGQSVNVVPDWSEIEVDRRIIPGEAATHCLTRVRDSLLNRLGPTSADWIEFLPPWVNMPALAPSEAGSDEWVGVVRRAIAEAIGRTPEVTGVPYGTDAGPLGAAGLPCLVFGPGDIAQAHTKDEWIELDQLSAAVDAYYQIACALGE
jgi:acetylornithine deacetylase